MMSWIVRSSLKFRYLVVTLAAGMMFVGVGIIGDMPVDVFPEFAPPKIEIQTSCLGLTSSEVEELVTVPLEQTLSGLGDVDVIRSKSVPQLSSVQLLLNDDADQLRSRQLVSERVSGITPTLPTWCTPPKMLQPLSATSRVMKIGLSSETLSVMDQSLLARYKIRTRLLQVPGVANIAIWGQRNKQLQVQVIPAKLVEHGITIDDVRKVTSDAFEAGLLSYSGGAAVGSGGFLETANQRMFIEHRMTIETPEQLAQVPIGIGAAGERVVIGDVANVVNDNQLMIGDAVINDGPGLMLIVEKLPWGNTLDITIGVEAAMKEIQPGLDGLVVDTTIFRPATFVELAIGNLTETLFLGSLLVVVVLVLFLFSWRSALISVVTIPLSLMASGLVLAARGVAINTMVLAGMVIALGAVVDDAIVDTENIVRRLRMHRVANDGRSTSRVIFEASLEVRGAIVYASMIEALALLPVLFLTGLTGSFFRPLAVAYALAVVVSMLVALIVTPALSMILLTRGSLDRGESPVVRWLQRRYERSLSRVVASPLPALSVAGLIVIAGFAVVPRLGQSLLPEFKERDFLMHWVTKPDTSLTEEVRISTAASKELRAIPGVRNFGAHIGQALMGDEVVGVNFGENWISIDPGENYDETLRQIQETVDGYPGVKRDVQTYLKERIREVLTGSGEAVVIRISGPDLGVLRERADAVLAAVRDIDGLIDSHVELQTPVPQIEVEVDLDAARRYGVKPGDVRRAAATFLAGEEVADTYRNGKAFDVMVWSEPQSRASLTDISSMLIDIPGGGTVALSELARVEVTTTPNQVLRDSFSRRIDIGGNVSGRDIGSIVGEVNQRLKNVTMPFGYRVEVLGEYKERQDADRRLLIFGLLAAAGIFMLLVVSFKSGRLATLSFFTLPMALVGGVLAAYIWGDGVISLGSLVGFFTILGIVARNGIMQISHYQHLEQHEGETFGVQLVLRGSRERLAPILMTALTTGLALVPLLISGNIPGQEIEYPMAIVILGGLVISTLLNLFVVPSLYLRFGRSSRAK
jgi:CzcA family heavy metal efflux pump